MTNQAIDRVGGLRARAAGTFRRVAGTLALGGLAACVPGAAAAQASPDAWQFRALIYAYLPSVSGTSRFPAGTGSNVNVDSADILGALKFAFMGTIEAQRGPWGGFVDLMYLNLGASKSGTRDLEIGNGQLPAGVSADANLDVKGSVWTLAGSYRLMSTPEHTFDVLAGARSIDLKETLHYSFSADVGPFVGPGRQGSGEARKQNWDAIVGVKGNLRLGDDRKWFVPYYFDIGTGESQVTWQAIGGIGYSFSWGDLLATWRFLDYDFKSGSAVDSVRFSGPVIGAAFHW
jgi:hypothetical protein